MGIFERISGLEFTKESSTDDSMKNKKVKFEESCRLSCLAYIELLDRNPEGSLELYLQAISACPENPGPYWSVIANLYEKNKNIEAFDYFQKVKKLNHQIFLDFKDTKWSGNSGAIPSFTIIMPSIIIMLITLNKMNDAKKMLINQLHNLQKGNRESDKNTFRTLLACETLVLSHDDSMKLIDLLGWAVKTEYMSKKEWKLYVDECSATMRMRSLAIEAKKTDESLDNCCKDLRCVHRAGHHLVSSGTPREIDSKNMENTEVASDKNSFSKSVKKQSGIKYLFFDTETTGLPLNWNASVENLGNWPRLVQIAWVLCDENGNKLESKDYIIKPEGFLIPADASSIHGITNQRAINEGVSLNAVLKEFENLMNLSTYLVAHNISFDEKIIGAEFLRQGMSNSIVSKKRICTKEKSTNFCAIPSPNGFSDYKWPKLSELHYKLFGTEFENVHNAMTDVNITAKCFWEMKRLGVL